MQLTNLLTPRSTLVDVPGISKKRLLESIAEFVADLFPENDPEDIFDGLIERERLGSTGIGEGVAIPHCRIESCQEIIGVLMRLQDPIDFDAIDKAPVDLVFTLLVPTTAVDTHLQALQTIATNFNEASYRDKLRAASSDFELYEAAVDPEF